jgi:hypothetical protein
LLRGGYADSPKVEKDREIPGCRVKSSIGGRQRFYNPLFDAVRPEIDRIAEVAWKAYRSLLIPSSG